MKIYMGRRDRVLKMIDVLVTEFDGNMKQIQPSSPLQHCIYHSPDGFEWGYGGSGPADLALSILNDYLHGDFNKAFQYHQLFKQEFIVGIHLDNWIITDQEIKTFLNTIEEREKRH